MTVLVAPAARILTHVYPRELGIRHDDGEGDGRTIYGLAVPYDTELDVSDWSDDYTEVFRKGSFAKTIRERPDVKLLFSHERRGQPVGVATELSEQDDGLHAAFRVSSTTLGNDLLTLVKDGVLDGLSIGFEPVTHKRTPGPNREPPSARDLHERTEVMLREVSLCNFPAYETAGVHGVRAATARHPSMAALVAERARLHEVRSTLVDRFGRVERIRAR